MRLFPALRALFLLGLLSLSLQAGDALLGSWQTQREFSDGNEMHREVERLRFLPGSFQFTLKADIEEGRHQVKGLTFVAKGLWKREGELLVLFIQQIEFQGVEESHGIDPASYRSLIKGIRGRYLNDPIRIFHIDSEKDGVLTMKNGNGEVKRYRRGE